MKKNLLRIGLSVLLLAGIPCIAQSASSNITKEFVYTEAPFPSAHASTLVRLKNGDILAAWFGGAREGANDVAIWGARRTAAGWSAPVELVREPNVPCWNPVLFQTHDGKLWLYYKYGRNPREWTGARLVSNDEGKTWSKPEHLPAGLLGPIKDKPLVLADGTIVSGTSIESYSAWAVWVDRSTDNGKTWHRSGPITVPANLMPTPPPTEPPLKPSSEHVTGIIQPAIAQLGKNICASTPAPPVTSDASAPPTPTTTASPGPTPTPSTSSIPTPASTP